jgi:hypothetical protein
MKTVLLKQNNNATIIAKVSSYLLVELEAKPGYGCLVNKATMSHGKVMKLEVFPKWVTIRNVPDADKTIINLSDYKANWK